MIVCQHKAAAFVQINQVTLTAVTYGSAQKVCLKNQSSNMHSSQQLTQNITWGEHCLNSAWTWLENCLNIEDPTIKYAQPAADTKHYLRRNLLEQYLKIAWRPPNMHSWLKTLFAHCNHQIDRQLTNNIIWGEHCIHSTWKLLGDHQIFTAETKNHLKTTLLEHCLATTKYAQLTQNIIRTLQT